MWFKILIKRLALPLLAALALPTAVNADIRSYCFDEWGENYEMVEYCMKNQSNAASNIYNSPDSNIKNNCLREWGENYEMVEYCMKQQSAALQRIGGGTYNDNNFDSRKNSNTINALPCTNYIIVDQKKTCLN